MPGAEFATVSLGLRERLGSSSRELSDEEVELLREAADKEPGMLKVQALIGAEEAGPGVASLEFAEIPLGTEVYTRPDPQSGRAWWDFDSYLIIQRGIDSTTQKVRETGFETVFSPNLTPFVEGVLVGR